MWLLVLGANSDMGQAIARMFAWHEKANLYLASRGQEKLAAAAQDFRIRYQVEVKTLNFDARDYASHQAFYQSLDPKPDGVLLCFGVLGDQARAQADFNHARTLIETNYVGAVSILEIAAADFEQRGRGFIIAVSSVAGLRGRKSNYVYGSAKGALAVYLQGLRHRLINKGVRVLTVLPGFARTKMTEGLDLPPKLVASPEEVALAVYKAHKKGKNTVYVKGVWRYIMYIIRFLPDMLFHKTDL